MESLAATLSRWHACHGRHDLPWQRERSAYRVWISEIMLQQTQVATVVGYYERFMRRFPDVSSLAAASLDEVLHLWSGLGYYSRARNLHRAARQLIEAHGGRLPTEAAALEQLPGIGRSTAAAILALACGVRATILDGNVKRVLSRVFGIEGPAGERGTEIELWRRAEECTPAAAEVAVYTQAIMDFGATLCTRHAPLCMHCPLQTRCAAFALGRVAELPQPRPRRARQTRRVVMLLAQQADGSVLLQRRPAHGVWGGLWTPPEFASREDAESYCSQYLAPLREPLRSLPELHHAFTHFDLAITPLQGRCANGHGVMDGEGMLWYNAREPALIGMPAPVAALLAALR